jgi:hypothetical protein
MDKSVLTENDKNALYDKALNELCTMYGKGLFDKGFYLAFHRDSSHLFDPHSEIPIFFPSSSCSDRDKIQFLKKLHGFSQDNTEYEIAVVGDIVKYDDGDFGVYGMIKVNETRSSENDDKTEYRQPFVWYSTSKEGKAQTYGQFSPETLDVLKERINSGHQNLESRL